MKGVPFKLVSTIDEVKQLIQHCKKTKYCCLDFETTSLKFYEEEEYPTILGVSFQIGSAWVIPLGHYDSPFKHNFPKILRLFSKGVLEDPEITKIGHNIKFEEKWLMRYKCRLIGRVFDTLLAKYLLDEERPHDLKSITALYYPKYAGYEDEIRGLVKKHGWAGVPIKPLAKYCALDCHIEFQFMMWFEEKLIKKGFYRLFRSMYMPRQRGLAECEFKGALIDKPYLTNLKAEYEKKIEGLNRKLLSIKSVRRFERKQRRNKIKLLVRSVRKEIFKIRKENPPNALRLIQNRENKIARIMSGELTNKERYEGVNFGSPKQMVEFLYTSEFGLKLKIIKYTVDKKTKKESNRPSTDEETLERLKKYDKSGFIDTLLELRGESKLYSTYVKGMYIILDKNNRVHTNFKLHGTVTGRLSSEEPNLQNIPRDTTASDIKRMFIPDRDCILLECDYSQAELRVVAEWANEKTMIEWFKIGRNIHVASACRANKCEDRYDEIFKITKNEDHPDHVFWTKRKKRAKTINFGILYEQSPKKLKETLEKDGEKVSLKQAEKYMAQWFKDFPAVHKYMKNQHAFVKKHGYVLTAFGFKRRLPNIDSSNYGLMLQAQRQSTNTPAQGTAAQFGTFSAVRIRQERRRGNIVGIKQEVYNVHDSLGFYILPEYAKEIIPKVTEICAFPGTLKYFGFEFKKVKMQANAETGPSWGELRGYKETDDQLVLKNKYLNS